MPEHVVVTGAFSYTGRRIATKLLDRGTSVTTLTGHPNRAHRFGDRIRVRPFDFDDPRALTRSLEGASVLINTYWSRFNRGTVTFDRAVRHSLMLFEAARRAGVERIVHISITNPDQDPSLPYFAGKATLERWLHGSAMSHAIVRPTVVFGHGDVFINNIAWLLRTFPVFAVPGSGTYRLQPVHVDDVADLCVDAVSGRDVTVVDAAGPEVYTFEELLETIKCEVGARCRLLHVPPRLAVWLARVIGTVVGDVLVTQGEVDGLMRGLIVSGEPSVCPTRFSEWLRDNARTLGTRYESEVRRNYEVAR